MKNVNVNTKTTRKRPIPCNPGDCNYIARQRAHKRVCTSSEAFKKNFGGIDWSKK
ncbi:hypothetical protein ES703_31688 [subsurface metagenome]